MTRIALQLTPEILAGASALVGVDPENNPLGDSPYAVITMISETEFNFKLMSDDEIFDAAKNDSELHILSL